MKTIRLIRKLSLVGGVAAVALTGATLAVAQPLNSFFTDSIVLNGDISDFFQVDGVTPKPGVCVANDANGLAEPPVADQAAKDGLAHPSGFNQRRIMTAYNPTLNNGTLYIGVDLPGGTGANSSDLNVHSLPGNPNPNYADSLVGIAIPGGGRGKIVPFDADGNGEADTIGRTAAGASLFRCPGAAGDTFDVLNCTLAGASGATDNPRTASGETIGARENYVAAVVFGNPATPAGVVSIEFFQDANTPAGVAQLRVTVNGVQTAGAAQVSTSTLGDGAPLGFDVEFAIPNINSIVPDPCARLKQTVVADSGSNRDGASQGEDQIVLVCEYAPPQCDITPSVANLCIGSCTNFTVNVIGAGPFTVRFTGPGVDQTRTGVIGSTRFDNICCNTPGVNTFTATVTDPVGCSTNCSATLVCNANPTCTLTPPQSICERTCTNITITPAGGTPPYSITWRSNGVVIAAFNNQTTIQACVPGLVTDTWRADIVDSAGCTNFCQTTLTGIPCNPKICVTKEVTCLEPDPQTPGAVICPTTGYAKSATGIVSQAQSPAFCYKITVRNCGEEDLINVTVNDDKLGDLTSTFFPGGTPASNPFKINDSVTRYVAMEWDEDTTNTVTGTGTGIVSRLQVRTNDFAIVRVIPIRVACRIVPVVDGVEQSCGSTVPTDASIHTILWRFVVCNVGEADVKDVVASISCSPDPIRIASLPVGACVTNDVCPTNVSCPFALEVEGSVTALADAGTNGYCIYDIRGSTVTARSDRCPCSVSCLPPSGCRTTGGGKQLANDRDNLSGSYLVWDTYTTQPDVRYVTHGGQVGAPFGRQTDNPGTPYVEFDPDSDCIHGRWTHVRHMKGGLQGNFHATSFDSLMCACLDYTTNRGNLTPAPNPKFGELCNADSKKGGPGPEPRPASANKITFTGVGNYANPNGRRQGRVVLFRVDIEDRSEPGGYHPGGQKAPPDRYRIRLWELTEAELRQLNDPADKLCDMRRAIAASTDNVWQTDGAMDFNTGKPVANGTAVFGIRAPNVDDGGALTHGNHQLHPEIKPCTKDRHTCP